MNLHFVDIHIRADTETPADTLLSALFGRLHQVLVHNGALHTAVTFPGYRLVPVMTLGTTMRLVGPKAQLQALPLDVWAEDMEGEIDIMPMLSVPADVPHRTVRRAQSHSNVERMRRRQMRRHGITWEQAVDKIPATARKLLSLPHLDVESASSKEIFRFFIKVGEEVEAALGPTNAYGLSATGTVPWF